MRHADSVPRYRVGAQVTANPAKRPTKNPIKPVTSAAFPIRFHIKAEGGSGASSRSRAALEVLVRHLTNDTPNCEETINRLFDVLDVPEAVSENERSEEAREELEAELDDAADGQDRRRDLHLASFH